MSEKDRKEWLTEKLKIYVGRRYTEDLVKEIIADLSKLRYPDGVKVIPSGYFDA